MPLFWQQIGMENISSARHKTKNISSPEAPTEKAEPQWRLRALFIRKSPNDQLK